MSTLSYTQIEPTSWPSGYGDAIAVVRVAPDRFARAHGLSFFRGSDNLDEYEAALVRLRSGRMLGLLRHLGVRATETEVHADSADDFAAALREFLDAFRLSVDDLAWMRDEVFAEDLRPVASAARSAAAPSPPSPRRRGSAAPGGG